ncbi:MAG: hypothetical protein KDD27_07945 [Saprospiraceae bacterium]|nr:hypothetical protein [Saprospiraceae bacterium]
MKNNTPSTAHLKGTRTETAHDGNAKVWLNGKQLNLQASLKYCSKSPTGFNWGYGGSGPAQLAHEVCRQLYGLETANLVFQDFKWRFLVTIEGDTFDLTLELEEFNVGHVMPLIETAEDTDLCETQNGPTGHGETCYFDADQGL